MGELLRRPRGCDGLLDSGLLVLNKDILLVNLGLKAAIVAFYYLAHPMEPYEGLLDAALLATSASALAWV